jgi:hypothetical protein
VCSSALLDSNIALRPTKRFQPCRRCGNLPASGAAITLRDFVQSRGRVTPSATGVLSPFTRKPGDVFIRPPGPGPAWRGQHDFSL